ncbi:glycosyltransferase family 2 protein [candidate division KSB1 bacterium]|nr:glycosyltransferase family 2 protein [candidate division KSB1 bacterium]
MSAKLPISLVVIAHNEERNIERCLRAAEFCAERIVVDSGSTDGTPERARSCGARVIARSWTGYRDQKNFGSAQATQPWVLCIDADEVVSAELQADIRSRFNSEPPEDAFEMNRHSYYAGKLINHSGWYPQWRLFLYRKGAAEWGGHEPHTTIEFKGTRKARLRGDLYHHTYSNIRHHMSKLVAQAHDSAVAMQAAGRRASWLDICLRSPWAIFRAYWLDLGVLDGFYGLVIAVSAGYYTFLKYIMLRELNRSAPTSVETR